MTFRAVLLFCIGLLPAHFAHSASKWETVSPEISASFLAFDGKGTLYAIDTGHHLFYLEKDSIAWKPLLKSKLLKSVSVAPDGSITVLDLDNPFGYVRPAGAKWESKPMDLLDFDYTKGGSRCMLTRDGRVLFDGSSPVGSFRFISAMQQADGIYLLSIDKVPYRYVKGDISPQTLPGNVVATAITGTGYNGKGGHYVLDASSGKLMMYDPGNAVVWQPLDTPVRFDFIALDPKGVLFGVGTDHRIYKQIVGQ